MAFYFVIENHTMKMLNEYGHRFAMCTMYTMPSLFIGGMLPFDTCQRHVPTCGMKTLLTSSLGKKPLLPSPKGRKRDGT